MENKYKKLFSPAKINKLTLKNRIMMLSMGIPGQVGDMALHYSVARARGGAAAMTTGRPYPGMVSTCPGRIRFGSGPTTPLFASYSVRQSAMPKRAAMPDRVSPGRTV